MVRIDRFVLPSDSAILMFHYTALSKIIHKLIISKNTIFIDIMTTKIYLMESKWLTLGLNKGTLFNARSIFTIQYI